MRDLSWWTTPAEPRRLYWICLAAGTFVLMLLIGPVADGVLGFVLALLASVAIAHAVVKSILIRRGDQLSDDGGERK